MIVPIAGAQADGDLDPTYGNPAAPGREINFFDLGPSGFDAGTGVAVDGVGRVLVVGLVETADPSFPYAVGLARFTASGEVDTTFGNNPALPGTLLLDLAGSLEYPGRTISVEADGRIVIAASRLFSSALASVGVFARIASDGSSIESTVAFNLPAVPVSLPPSVRGFARDRSGRYLPFGKELVGGQPVVARLSSALIVDPGFGTGGWVQIAPFEPTESGTASVWQLAVDLQGRLVGAVSGAVSGGDDLAAVVRLLASGAPDPSFGVGGVARVIPDFLTCPFAGACHWSLVDVVVAPDGAIFAAGWVEPDGFLPRVRYGWLVRLSADGVVEQQAGVLPLYAPSLELTALAIDPRGGLLVAGGTSTPPAGDGGMFAARYDASTLTIDPNFALGGSQEFDFVGLPGYTQPQASAGAIALDSGRPLLAGAAVFGATGSNSDFAVARLWSDAIFFGDFETGTIGLWSASAGSP
jgi:uncharacterized delta-60 repeat protein